MLPILLLMKHSRRGLSIWDIVTTCSHKSKQWERHCVPSFAIWSVVLAFLSEAWRWAPQLAAEDGRELGLHAGEATTYLVTHRSPDWLPKCLKGNAARTSFIFQSNGNCYNDHNGQPVFHVASQEREIRLITCSCSNSTIQSNSKLAQKSVQKWCDAVALTSRNCSVTSLVQQHDMKLSWVSPVVRGMNVSPAQHMQPLT